MSEGQKPQSVTLRRKPLKLDPHIVPDPKWPGMYRIKRPDGSLSDMANLTRCRDALRSFDERPPIPSRPEILVPRAMKY
jgi:hypothetical protein